MASSGKEAISINQLIELLNEDRSLILEKIDQGCWQEFRQDLAELERELGQFLSLASKRLES